MSIRLRRDMLSITPLSAVVQVVAKSMSENGLIVWVSTPEVLLSLVEHRRLEKGLASNGRHDVSRR